MVNFIPDYNYNNQKRKSGKIGKLGKCAPLCMADSSTQFLASEADNGNKALSVF
jgi:hypothetical protein